MENYKKILLTISALLILILAILFIYSKLQSSKNKLPTVSETISNSNVENSKETTLRLSTQSSTEVSSLQGNIYITSSKEGDLIPEPYTLNLKSQNFTQTGLDDNQVGYFHNINTSDNSIVFVATNKTDMTKALNGDGKLGKAFQIYVGKLGGTGDLPLADTSTKITSNYILDKKDPTLSPSSKYVLYTAPSAMIVDKKDPRSILNLSIHLVSIGKNTDTEIVTSAKTGEWIDENYFVYISKKGINIFNLTNKKSINILAIDAGENFKLSISNNKKYLAISAPDSRKVFILKIDDVTNAKISTVWDISVLGYWTVFSPDDNILAVQSVQNPDDKTSKPNIMFYDLSSLRKLGNVIDLSNFNNDKLFMTSWSK